MMKLCLYLAASLLVSSPARSDTGDDGCRLNVRSAAVAARKAELPEDVRLELDKRLGGVAEVGQRYQDTDNGVTKTRPRFRFHSAILIDGEWFVSLERGSTTRFQTVGLRKITDAVTGYSLYHLWPPHDLIGPTCITIRAMLDGVERP